MKRGAMLVVADVKSARFDTYGNRGFLPFSLDDDRNFRGYSLDDAIRLSVLKVASESTDVAAAAHLARHCLDKLAPLHPLFPTDATPLFGALIRLNWKDAPEGHNGLDVVAGRWCDLSDLIAERVAFWGAESVSSVLALPLSDIAKSVFRRAREFGLPEGDNLPGVPEDLTGFPAWFAASEVARRELFLNWDREEK